MRSVRTQSPSGTSSGHVTAAVERRPCTLPARRRASVRVSATTHSPVGAEHGDEGVGRRGVVGEAARPGGDVGSDPLGRPALERGPASGGLRSARAAIRPVRADRTVQDGVADRLPAGATAEMGGEGAVDGARTSLAPPGARAATRTMIPGVQKPHWEAPWAAKDRHQPSASGRPASVVTARPATRDAGVTQETRGWPSTQTVQHPH